MAHRWSGWLVAGVLGLAVSGCVTTATVGYGYGYDADVGQFYGALSPYGEWLTLDGYGHVWRPYTSVVGPDFIPYATGGYWAPTDYGWSFETNWDWGWAPFHYGNWFEQPGYGWVWVPGHTWAASWCEWRYGGGYVGWRPMPPAGVMVGPSFVFVDAPHFVEPNVAVYIAPPSVVPQIVAVTQPMPRVVMNGRAHWFAGPPVTEIARVAGRPIRTVPLATRPPAPGRVIRGPIVQAPPPRAFTGGTPMRTAQPGVRPMPTAPMARPAPPPAQRAPAYGRYAPPPPRAPVAPAQRPYYAPPPGHYARPAPPPPRSQPHPSQRRGEPR